MRHLVRAAAYLPSASHDGFRVAAPDEDLFTLLATALERLDPPPSPSPSPISIHLVADLPAEFDSALGAVWGGPVSVLRADSGLEALSRSLSMAESGAGGEAVVLSAEGPGTGGPEPARSGHGSGAGAVAFRFGEGTGPRLTDTLGSLRSSGSMLDLSFALFHRLFKGSGDVWSGDWASDRSTGRPVEKAKGIKFRSDPLASVSEGAYIPRPRYRESLPSRWRFRAERCPRCSRMTFPARGSCRSCGNREGLEAVGLPRDNLEVIATTVIGPGGQPTEFDAQVESLGPYEVVLAELAPGSRVTLPVTDAEPGAIRIGDRVDTRLRRLYPMEGEWRYGRKAVPRRES